MIEVSDREIARYLGYHKVAPDAQVQGVIQAVLSELNDRCSPRFLSRTEPLTANGSRLELGPIPVDSKALALNLAGCEQVVLFGATLGPEPDYMIRRYEKVDLLKSVVAQACSAAMIEAYVDQQQDILRAEYEKKGLYMRPRFSPGYGDLSLDVQKDFVSVLQMGRFLGVTLTDGMLMMPSKSVTAVIGLSRQRMDCTKTPSACEVCGQESCEFRR